MIFLACSPPSQHGLSLPSPSSQTEVWFEHRTADGRTYYSHPQTQKTTWERPPNAQIIPQPSPGNVLHEQSTNHISLRKIGLDVLQSHPLRRMCFAHYLEQLRWDGDCYFMHADGWPYSKWQRIFESTVSLCSCSSCSCLSFNMHALRCALIGINSVWKLQQT